MNLKTRAVLIKVKPNAKQNRLIGFNEAKILEVAIAAKPIENQVNKLLIKWLAKTLKVPQTQIKLIRGEHSRIKELAIPDKVLALLEAKQ